VTRLPDKKRHHQHIVHECGAAMRQGRLRSRRVPHTWVVSDGVPRPRLEDMKWINVVQQPIEFSLFRL
jgi:hypothetical protein